MNAGQKVVVLPVDPTEDMLVAGQEEFAKGHRGPLEDCVEAEAIYRAMVAAAPAGQGDAVPAPRELLARAADRFSKAQIFDFASELRALLGKENV